MKVWSAPYVLTMHSGRTREGALIRVESDHGRGFADVHPWPELGDWPLAEQLKALREKRETPLLKRSFALAALDCEARSRGRSAFEGLEIPTSHALIAELSALSSRSLIQLHDEGFQSLKIKVGANVASELRVFQELREELSKFRLRLDFNARLPLETVREFLRGCPGGIRESLEFLEDPLSAEPQQWLSLAREYPLALDRIADQDLSRVPIGACSWVILKPAVQEPSLIVREAARLKARIVVTSYLDHPVGQIGAALEAARLVKQGVALGDCGLSSHRVYETNEFSGQMMMRGPSLLAPVGAGIGFDESLHRLKWGREL